MKLQFLHLLIAPLVQQPKCELTPNEHSMYIRFLWATHRVPAKMAVVYISFPPFLSRDLNLDRPKGLCYKIISNSMVNCRVSYFSRVKTWGVNYLGNEYWFIWGLYNKTLYGRNLLIFLISFSVCLGQAFPAQSNVCG